MEFKPPKGTRDFLPADMKVRRWVFDVARKVFEKYNLGEVETPAFESLELLEAKDALGEQAVKDIYRFEDKAGRKLGLRFDPTTPIARIVASKRDLTMPLRWCYNFVRMWRYEDIGKGRYREFYQSGVEIIGSKSSEADALVLKIVIDFMKGIGIENFTLRVNSRKILDMLADRLKLDKEKRVEVFRIIDKLDKQGKSAVRKELMQKGITTDNIEAIMNFIEMKLDEVKNYLNIESVDIEDILNQLLGDYRNYVKFDPSIARGLDYYTGFIFETLVQGNEDLGSVASGGRYDSLIEKYGGSPTPATGVGIGVERLLEIVKDKFEKQTKLIYIAPVSKNEKQKAMEITDSLRVAGLNIETDIVNRSLGSQMKYAATQKTDFVIIIGEKDLTNKQVTLRDMKDGSEIKADISTLAELLKKE
ncbi:histidine--tRNA ligase [archaeon]|nr:histidine--tRNA ligase [archaeon]|tara:strand:- start:1546 stop:2802 length:1257 start_codon:yes stop_codon:yes gene_type:complete